MSQNKRNLIFGVIIGIILAFFYFHFFAPRYVIENTGMSTVKFDKWTGQSWRFVDNNWKKMLDLDEEWEKVDATLQEALNIPSSQIDTAAALNKLRERFPVLEGISDDELLERIKLVYSKVVLCNLYLSEFIKTQEPVEDIRDKGIED